MPDDGRVVIGRVIKPHGIRGELVVEATGDTLATLGVGDAVWIGADATSLLGLRPHRGRWLVTLDNCGDRDGAEARRGVALSVAEERLRSPGEDEWFVDDLIGARVRTAQGRSLGTVIAVIPGAGRDLLETDRGSLVPMVREWLVDSEPGLLVFDLPIGLLDLEEES